MAAIHLSHVWALLSISSAPCMLRARAPPRYGTVCCAAPSAGSRLILVDEQDSMRRAVHRYLIKRGFRCDAFASGDAALAVMARSTPPDVLITEVTASTDGLDGLDLLRTVRSDTRLCSTPVVLLTTRGLTPDRIAGYSAGASVYLSKPFDPEELVAIVRSLIHNAMLARNVLVNSEVRALRAEVASMRQLLQAVLVPDSTAQYSMPGAGEESTGPPPQLPSSASLAEAGSGSQPLPLPPPPLGAVSAWPAAEVPKLTRREMSVLELVGDGKLNKEIAAQLGVGLRYVEKVVKRLLEKTATPNRTALVRRALRMGLLSDDAPLSTRPVFKMGGTPHPQIGAAPEALSTEMPPAPPAQAVDERVSRAKQKTKER